MVDYEFENVTPEQRTKAEKLRKTTAALLGVFSTILLVWDVKVANNDVKEDTISELLRDVSHDFWVLPFALMGVMGHLFWNRPGTKREIKFNYLVGAVVVVLARDMLGLVVQLPTFTSAPVVVGVLGFMLGAAWWPQLLPNELRDNPTTDD